MPVVAFNYHSQIKNVCWNPQDPKFPANPGFDLKEVLGNLEGRIVSISGDKTGPCTGSKVTELDYNMVNQYYSGSKSVSETGRDHIIEDCVIIS